MNEIEAEDKVYIEAIIYEKINSMQRLYYKCHILQYRNGGSQDRIIEIIIRPQYNKISLVNPHHTHKAFD